MASPRGEVNGLRPTNCRLSPENPRCQGDCTRNNRIYRFLLDVALLLYQCLIPDDATGQFLFRNFVRHERRMRSLFERFVRNFLRREQRDFRVDSESMEWEQTTGSLADLAFLPGMRTDVTLRRPGRTLVIDTKFYREPLQQHRGRWTVRSGHLYQLFSYLQNLVARGQAAAEVDGMLLYPEASRTLDLSFHIQGHFVRVRTINLNRPWREIHDDLLDLLPFSTSSSSPSP